MLENKLYGFSLNGFDGGISLKKAYNAIRGMKFVHGICTKTYFVGAYGIIWGWGDGSLYGSADN